MLKKEQIVHTVNYCEKFEKDDSDYYIMLSEFIDNSIANFYRNKDKIHTNSKILLKIIIDSSNYKIIFEDNCFGMNSYPFSEGDEIGERMITNREDIIKCFDFFPTPMRKGIRKYGFGMKSAIYWIGKTWKIQTYVESLNEFCEITSTIKNINTIHPQIFDEWKKPEESLYKNIGTRIEIKDLSAIQKERFPKSSWLWEKFENSKDQKRKNYLIYILANKYKFYIKENLEICFEFLGNNSNKKFILDKQNLNKFIFEFENFSQGYENEKKHTNWYNYIVESFEGNEEDLIVSVNDLSSPLVGYKGHNMETIESSVFYNLLKDKKQIKKSFYCRDKGFDGKLKNIRIDLGLISYASIKNNKYITFQEFHGISHFLNNIEITTRPHKHIAITGSGRGGPAYRVVAEVFLEEGYIEPDPNKKGFNPAKLGIITKWVKEIISTTKLIDISQILTNMNRNVIPSLKQKQKQKIKKKEKEFFIRDVLEKISNNSDREFKYNSNDKTITSYDKFTNEPKGTVSLVKNQEEFIFEDQKAEMQEEYINVDNYISETFNELNEKKLKMLLMIFYGLITSIKKELESVITNDILEIDEIHKIINVAVNKQISKAKIRKKLLKEENDEEQNH